jgi:hypothetical protein
MKHHAFPLAALALLVAGCSHVEQSPALTQTDPKLATQAHWVAQPATATVVHDDFDQLWEAAVGAARWRGFRPDRANYREGVLVSHPVVSKQIFEPLKRDTPGFTDQLENTLATMRRIVRFEIAEREDGTFELAPKVLVERYTSTERRITSVTQYRESFNIEAEYGNKERDKGVNIPTTYWYTTGRDEVLERHLAEAVRARLPKAVASR